MTQTLQLEKTLGLRIEGGPLHFVVVGAGGTGGHLLPNLIRMIGIKNDSSPMKHSISIIDADVV